MSEARHHTIDVYGAELHLATNRKQWKQLRRQLDFLDKNAPEAGGLAQFATYHPNDGGMTVPHLVLWLDVKAHRTTLELIDTAAHEASHAASQLMKHIGHDVEGIDEPHAYLVGWLTQWMLTELVDNTTPGGDRNHGR